MGQLFWGKFYISKILKSFHGVHWRAWACPCGTIWYNKGPQVQQTIWKMIEITPSCIHLACHGGVFCSWELTIFSMTENENYRKDLLKDFIERIHQTITINLPPHQMNALNQLKAVLVFIASGTIFETSTYRWSLFRAQRLIKPIRFIFDLRCTWNSSILTLFGGLSGLQE